MQVPSNIEDKNVLKRFLTSLVSSITSGQIYTNGSGSASSAITSLVGTSVDEKLVDALNKVNVIRSEILTYIADEIEVKILQNKDNIALIAEEFGTFTQEALAASWYGLSVKAGGTVVGLEIGALDPNITTPGDESSYFRISSDNFLIGRAYEDLSQSEKDYLAANNLPNFGTVYNQDGSPTPAFLVTWDDNAEAYQIFFNGIVNFSNINNVPDFALSNDVIDQLTNYLLTSTYNTDKTDIDNSLNSLQNQIDGAITTWFNFGVPSLLNYPAIDWTTDETKNKHLGDIYYNKQDGKAYRFAYEDIDDTPNAGIIYTWILIADSDITLALSIANEAKETADGKITTFYTITQPTAEGVGDLWINSANKLQYIWDGSFWRLIDMATAINNGTTTINGGRIDTSVIGTGIIYNTNANSSNYTMKIDLNNGEIHIK